MINKLSNHGFVTVVCSSSNRSFLQQVINFITVEPIETEYIKAYARLVSIRRNGENEEIDCELMEF